MVLLTKSQAVIYDVAMIIHSLCDIGNEKTVCTEKFKIRRDVASLKTILTSSGATGIDDNFVAVPLKSTS